MKALLSLAPGGPETLQLTDVPEPVAGPGKLAVKVIACGINYPDVLIIEDKYQFKPERPFAPGCEITGEVVGVGEGVEGWQVGDRLVAVTGWGGLAEQVVIGAHEAFHLPEGRDPLAAAGLLMTYATSLYALDVRGELKSGETLLVLGAAGGVGLASIEIGKALGARVIAAVSSEEKAEVARSVGADEALVYEHAPLDKDQSKALATAFKSALGGEGADVVMDPVGGDYAEPALRALAWEGRYLVVGFSAGIPKLPLNLTLLKSCDVRGVFWGAYTMREPSANRALVQRLFEFWDADKIAPRVDRIFPLAEASTAIAALAGRSAIGKIVVTLA